MVELKFGFEATSIVKDGRINQEDVDLLSEWLVTQEVPRCTDEQLVLFLLSCENNLEATKNTINAYYSIRNANPNIFTARDVKEKVLAKALRTVEFYTTFDNWTEDGYSIIFGRLCDTYYGNFDLASASKAIFMNMDAMIHGKPPNGFVVVFDMKGVGFMHLTRLYPRVLLPCFRYIQEGLPVRLVAVHVLNSNYLVTALMKIISPFMNAELINKIHFHPPSMNMDDFYKNILDKKFMAEDYGGELPPVKQLHEQMIDKFDQLKDYFDAEEKQRCDFIKQYKSI